GAVLVVDGAQGVGGRKRAGAVLVGVLLVAVTHLEELLRRQVGGQLAGEQVVLERNRDRLAVLGREDAGVDGVLGRPVGLLIGGEEVDAVLDDGAAEGGAVLLAVI